jgi:hypothetical protein
VVVNGAIRGELSELRQFSVDDIETMRYLSATDATTKYGTGYPGGVIEVSMRGTGAVPTGSRTAFAGRVIPAVAEGRLPVPGDALRVECLSQQNQERRIGEGSFEGVVDDLLLLGVGSPSQSVAVSVVNVRKVEILERRSRTGWGKVIGGLLGAVAGGIQGGSTFNPEGSLHFKRGWYATVGTILGGAAGVAVGPGVGGLFKTDAWIDAPPRLDCAILGIGASDARRLRPTRVGMPEPKYRSEITFGPKPR